MDFQIYAGSSSGRERGKTREEAIPPNEMEAVRWKEIAPPSPARLATVRARRPHRRGGGYGWARKERRPSAP
ncbi:hypothetical protein GUJ93_ZPchr0002g22983 [Zizania palustris]|uniref:Uncharacterized protein n=1 Tax=Zizania palustris TaxID=103762 RepID=A0A8J5SR51_ZIZPA|nr:hypothetical protein GUJ93_ZPchr0002g22983 [Zizania palustris]